MQRTAISAILAIASCALTAGAAIAQSFPVKPLRIVSTFQPGVIDGPLRAMTQKMGESMGQPVIIDVQAGAGGVIGAQTVMRAAPDGYTMLFASPGTIVTSPFLLKNKPYDPADFVPISATIGSTLVLLVSADFPANSVRELVDYARANPGKLAYGSNGVGSSYHLLMELIKTRHSLDITHVPYKAGSDALIAVVAKQIPIAFAPAGSAFSNVKAGKVRILAVLDSKRFPGLPDIPSMSEQVADYEPTPGNMWFYGPAGMPAPLVGRLQSELAKAVQSQEVADRLRAIAFFPMGLSPEDSAAQMKKDIEISQKAIRAAKISPE
jgi:tripartite-type tricarboxylate transporter receptor subunit TctC